MEHTEVCHMPIIYLCQSYVVAPVDMVVGIKALSSCYNTVSHYRLMRGTCDPDLHSLQSSMCMPCCTPFCDCLNSAYRDLLQVADQTEAANQASWYNTTTLADLCVTNSEQQKLEPMGQCSRVCASAPGNIKEKNLSLQFTLYGLKKKIDSLDKLMEVGHSRLILHRSPGIKFGTKQRGQCQVPTSRFCVTFDYSCYHSPIEHSAVAPSDCMILSLQWPVPSLSGHQAASHC